MRVCLTTHGQPSTTPRLVKEADALTEAGHEVHVICGRWIAWADETDKNLLSSRDWSCTYVGGHRNYDALRYAWTRLRTGGSRRIASLFRSNRILARWTLTRVLPELERAAKNLPADLYIAHFVGALPAAIAAARKHRAYVGFDAEDFNPGLRKFNSSPSVLDQASDHVEGQFIRRCDFVTTAAPSIAENYGRRYDIPNPVTIFNVFPLSQRPPEFRHSKERDPLTLYWFSQTIGADRGLEDIVRAMGSRQRYAIELHLRGRWQEGYRDKLYHLATSVGVRPDQIVAHEPGSPEDMVVLASQYDVGLALEQPVSHNRDICLTNKIFTYLLGGTAVIATATKGQQPIMQAIEGAGFCYEPGDVQTLARHLEMWAENRKSLQEARRQAWDWGTRRYNWDIEKAKFLDLIGQVMEKPAKHAQ